MKTNLSMLAAALSVLLLNACEQAPGSAAGKKPALVLPAAEPPKRHHDPAQVARGRAVYDKHCAACHGAEGKGQAGDWRIRDAGGNYPPPPLDDSAHAWHHPTAVLLDVIRNGSEPGEGNMPAFKNVLSEADMLEVVAYLKSLWSDPVYRLWWKLEQQSLED